MIENGSTVTVREAAFRFWGEMKEKHKRIVEEKDETVSAFEFLLGMFEWEGLPDTVRPEFLDLYFMTNGMASIRQDTKGNGDYVAMICDDGATPDAYGLGRDVFSRTANGHVYEDDKDSDVVAYGWNNLTRTPCVDAYRVGAYIAEIDTSLDLLVWWSRASRLFLADDNKQKSMLEESFASMKKGSPLTVVSSNVLHEIEEGKKGLEAVDLCDADFADKIDKIAYLREKRYDWFKDRYGMPARDTAKKAQVSIDEANGGTGSAMIVPLNMLKARQNFCDMCNQKFGWDCSVHFAGAWLGEMERYETTVVENGDLDIDGYDAIEEKGDVEDGQNAEKENGEAAEQNDEPAGTDEGSDQDKDGADGDESKKDSD